MQDKPYITIGIPTWNRCHYLNNNVLTLLDQIYALNLTNVEVFTSSTVSRILYGRASTLATAVAYFFPIDLILRYLYAHASSRSLNNPDRSRQIHRIEITHFGLGDLFHLPSGNLPDFLLMRNRGPFDNACRLFE